MGPFHPDSEHALEQATVALFGELGFATENLYGETFGADASHGREASSEVVFRARLRAAVERLNPDLSDISPRPVGEGPGVRVSSTPIESAFEEICRDRSALNPAVANQTIHNLLKNGVPVVWEADDEEKSARVRVIDWENPANNDYFLAQQMWVSGELYNRRCDLVACVNGIPLVFIELKKPTVNVKHAYNDNLRDYRNNTIPQLWWYNGFIILSNGSQSRLGTVTAEWEHYSEWKKISGEGEEGIISLETMIRGTCEPVRLLNLLENFVVYTEAKGGLRKVVAKNHQFLGVQSAVQAVKDIKRNAGRLGVFWHTQGSGKSLSMVFFCQYVMRRIPGNWTFVIVCDRQELDDQIYKTFANCGLTIEAHCQAEGLKDLRRLLTEDHRFVFTMIQKFQVLRERREDGTTIALEDEFPELSRRDDIIVITDEAHRSQYDTLALNMRKAMPKASFIGFTGTPLMAGEERTRDVFGDYVSIYNFRQSIDDGATVPLFYENRIPELQLTNEQFSEDMEAILEAAMLDEEQERKLERHFAREYHLITHNDRLDTIAKDLVAHFLGRGHRGKAMMVCIDRFTAVRMYDKVKAEWAEARKRLEYERLRTTPDSDEERAVLERMAYMDETDMAVVISSSRNEQADFAEKGLEILPHRQRMVKEDLETRFKDEDDPLRLVFLCAMWLTGFDVPACSTIYLDKPMRNHTLMQTIARANRVFPEKNNGLIVDYVGIFRDLQKALAIYGSGAGGGTKEGETPVADKRELVDMLRATIRATLEYCAERGVDVASIVAARGFEHVALIDGAVEKLVYPEEAKRDFLSRANLVVRLHKAIMPDPVAEEFAPVRSALVTIVDKLRPDPEDVDITEVMQAIDGLLDRSVATEAFVIPEADKRMAAESARQYDGRKLDLSKIDFDALKEKFATGRKRTILEKLRQAISRKLNHMVKLNRSRMDYLAKFQQMIDEYNAGSRNIEELFKQLTDFVQELDAEERRCVREGLTEEELAIFDILTKPTIELSQREVADVKRVARELLQTLNEEKLVLDWRKRQQSRADVLLCVETVLDELPRAYDKETWQQKCRLVYQHVFDNYRGAGDSVYRMAG